MRDKILIVDDAVMNREILREILQEEQYTVLEAEDGMTALATIEGKHAEIAAVLLDLVMPVMDGFAVLEQLNRRKLIGEVPVLVISGESSPENEQRCFDLGVSDFIGKPFNANLVKRRVKNAADLYAHKNELEQEVEKKTQDLRKAYQAVKIQAERLKQKNQEIIDVLGTVVEYRNLESGEHIQRVKGYTKILADSFTVDYPEYGLTPERIEIIVSASALHDIGKIAIPDKILLKPGRLDPDEYEYMKSHTTRGCEIMDSIKDIWETDYQKVGYEICRHHHERYDGKGYPDGLVGEAIPISAQLVSVADVYDALVNERCYKDAFSPEKAYHMILNGECGIFSPKLMEIFRKVRPQFEALAAQK